MRYSQQEQQYALFAKWQENSSNCVNQKLVHVAIKRREQHIQALTSAYHATDRDIL